jgi:hypothetical protein
MLSLLERQLEDLRASIRHIEDQHEYWSKVRTELAQGRQPIARRRAARGSLRTAVLNILIEVRGELGIADIHAALADRKVSYSRNSLNEVLARLRDSGFLKHQDKRWSLAPERFEAAH